MGAESGFIFQPLTQKEKPMTTQKFNRKTATSKAYTTRNTAIRKALAKRDATVSGVAKQFGLSVSRIRQLVTV